ncbi:MAG: hypothetical protein KIT11_02045 [Fimbriimonadaceae bacterium]|nr:hypothetical protein [Fimbriimonadaceae bacterium]QYK54848.1 MAG: hypothetical protein KF733_07490 [Fimbriimonadaceae bacterium]
MLTLGDVFATALLILGTAATLLAAFVAATLLAPARTAVAAQAMENRPWQTFFTGLLVGGPLLLLSIVVANLPLPVARALGAALVIGWFLLAVFGLSGLVRVVAARVRGANPGLSPLGATVIAGSALIGALGVPFIGWMLLTPFMLFLGVGAALKALLVPKVSAIGTVPEAS